LTEKLEDARAKAAIKAQIEADKKARAEKFAREKAIRDGQPIPGESSAPAPAPKTTAPPGVAGKDFKETRLQIRMSTGGQPYTTTLSSDAGKLFPKFIQIWTYSSSLNVTVLREVAEYLAGQTLSVDVETVSFAQHFPRLESWYLFPNDLHFSFVQESFYTSRFFQDVERSRTHTFRRMSLKYVPYCVTS